MAAVASWSLATTAPDMPMARAPTPIERNSLLYFGACPFTWLPATISTRKRSAYFFINKNIPIKRPLKGFIMAINNLAIRKVKLKFPVIVPLKCPVLNIFEHFSRWETDQVVGRSQLTGRVGKL